MPRSRVHDGVVFRRKESRVWWIRYRDRNGVRRRESTLTEDWNEAQKRLRDRLQARDNNVLDVVKKGESLSFGQWADFFLETYSKPPMRAEKTHEINLRAVKHLKGAFASSSLVDLTADHIELYLRDRLRQRVRIKSSLGFREKGVLQPATVHQEFRVLRRVLNVAVRKRLLPANPCSGVEFPVRVKGLFRPHYVSWSEQKQIELHAQPHLRNIVRIITETGLRVYKELMSMKKDQLDLPNAVVWIPDSKTPNGIAEVPLTPLAVECIPRSTGNRGRWTVSIPQRFEFDRTPGSVEDRLAKDPPTSEGPLLSDLRFAIHVCHSPQCGRRSRRVGDTIASPRGLSGLQTLLANETANEERSSGENQPPGQ